MKYDRQSNKDNVAGNGENGDESVCIYIYIIKD